MPGSADLADGTPSAGRYLLIATLIVWTLAVGVGGALIGGYPMIAALVALLVVGGLALGGWAVVSDVEGALQLRAGQEPHVSRVGTAFALGGAALGVIAVWLPFWDPASVRRAWEGGGVEIWDQSGRVLSTSDSLIQRGLGWLFIALAIWCAVSVLLAHSHPQLLRGSVDAAAAGIYTISLAAITAAVAVLSTPTVFAVQTWESLDPGPSVYAEGVAGLLMLIGGLRLRRAHAPMIATSVIVVLTAILLVWLLFRATAYHGPYYGPSSIPP
jgi:hypothetical protein